MDRDEKGSVISEEDKQKVASQPLKPVVPEWQDPKLLAELKVNVIIIIIIDLRVVSHSPRHCSQRLIATPPRWSPPFLQSPGSFLLVFVVK